MNPIFKEFVHKVSEAEERRAQERIAKLEHDAATGKQERGVAGPADPYDIREHALEQQNGAQKTPEVWCPVMEHFGFRWYEPSELDVHPKVGPMKLVPGVIEGIHDAHGRPIPNDHLYVTKRHTEGQWRNDLVPSNVPESLLMAFTLRDLVTGFRTPEGFDTWFRDRVARVRAAKVGIIIPRPRR